MPNKQGTLRLDQKSPIEASNCPARSKGAGENMANETRGLLYETIANAALGQAVKSSRTAGDVFWNEKPKGMTVTPDFTIGKSSDEPSHVVLVTASGSSKESEKKSWRNLGEMQEVKAQLPEAPIVVNIYFKSEVKQGVSAAGEYLYDSILHVEKKPYYKPLEKWVDDNLRSAAKNRDARRQLLKTSVKTDAKLSAAISSLAKDLAVALKQRRIVLDPLWKLMRADYAKPHSYVAARQTSVRRGVGKLAVLEQPVRQLVYESLIKRRGIPVGNLPNYVFDLGFLNKSIAGARLVDSEITEAIALLGPRTCEDILDRAPKSLDIWINPLRDLGRVEVHADFGYQHYDDFVNAKRFKRLLVECFNDPATLSGEPGDDKVWVYEIAVSLLKAKSGRLQGYGLAQLSVDTGLAESGKGAPLVRFIIPQFVQRQKPLRRDHLTALSSGLAKRFKEDISLSDIPKLKSKLVSLVIKENLEDRLIPYRNFEPLMWLLETELNKQGKLYKPKAPYGGWLNEYAGIGQASATTPFVRVGKTLIHWKSVSDAGKDHKRKELAARARNVKYEYDTTTKTFKRRAEVERLALIVDGTFTDADLKVLADAGWDIIVYPDEIADLVSKL
jgi:hypothetical protein